MERKLRLEILAGHANEIQQNRRPNLFILYTLETDDESFRDGLIVCIFDHLPTYRKGSHSLIYNA